MEIDRRHSGFGSSLDSGYVSVLKPPKKHPAVKDKSLKCRTQEIFNICSVMVSTVLTSVNLYYQSVRFLHSTPFKTFISYFHEVFYVPKLWGLPPTLDLGAIKKHQTENSGSIWGSMTNEWIMTGSEADTHVGAFRSHREKEAISRVNKWLVRTDALLAVHWGTAPSERL